MNSTQSSLKTRLKVGIFTGFGLLCIVVISVLVNNRPFWWRGCHLVKINVEDATGLKSKSPVRSLGIEIGYLQSVTLSESHVTLGICITAPVEILATTRYHIRGEGFLGDKFIELRPVKYLGPDRDHAREIPTPSETNEKKKEVMDLLPAVEKTSFLERIGAQFWSLLVPSVFAEQSQVNLVSKPSNSGAPASSSGSPSASAKGTQEIPGGPEGEDIQHVVTRVDELVHQMSDLTSNLRQGINPEDLKRTMKQLNQTLENASRTLAPEGGLNQTAQRTLAKLEDAIEQLRDLMTRVNKGEGSVGMLLNDPTYAEEIHLALRNVNKLLNRVGEVRFVVDLGGALLPAYSGGRGWFNLGIWPRKDRYYLIGIASDSRGRVSNTTVTTTAGGISQVTQTQVVDQTSMLLTAMMGKVFFERFDASVGVLYNDAVASLSVRLGPKGSEEKIQLRNDIYIRNSGSSLDDRVTLSYFPVNNFYLRGGLDSFNQVNGKTSFVLGAGITFDDEDIKLLFAFK